MKIKKLIALALSAVMTISSATIVLAQDQLPMFMSLTGEVTEITEPAYGQSIIHVEVGESRALFLTNYNTYVLGEEVQVGDTITGYFLAGAPMVLIYPPQYTAQLIVNGEFNNVKIDRFAVSEYDENAMVSSDGMLQINLSNVNTEDGTQLLLQDGQVFEIESLEDINNRKLVVVYDISTRSIPAITTPSLVVVLFELVTTLPQTISPEELAQIDPNEYIVWEDQYTPDFEFTSNNGIFINGELLETTTWRHIDGIFYVPLRIVAETLGATVTWDYDNHRVSIDSPNGIITFAPGQRAFMLNGEYVSIGDPEQPSLLIDERTYVPIRFFRDVFGMNNAYMHAGEAHIDNEEPMQ